MTNACRVQLEYGQDLSNINFQDRVVTFQDDQNKEHTSRFDFLVGCDGRRSRVRSLLEEQDPSMSHEEHVSDRSYKGFHRLPAVGKFNHP